MSNETIAEIVAWIRDVARSYRNTPISKGITIEGLRVCDALEGIADRIEAAARRECSTQKPENCVDGNAEAARHKCPTALLSLDEAIAHAEECADDTPCGKNHRQLADWLKELRSLKHGNLAAMREAVDYLCEKLAELDATFDPSEVDCLRAALSASPRNCDEMPDIDKLTMNDLAKSPCKSTLECASREELLALVRWLLTPAEERKGESEVKE